MKKLFLIGDSIRMGYCGYVKEALKDKAEVIWHDGNARFAEYTLYSIGDWNHDMKLGEDVDCVHWNVGLHDIIRAGGDEPFTPTEIYKYYIDRITKKIKFCYPNAKVIFATTTPVQEELFDFWFARKNSDIDAINKVAVEVMEKNDVEINDFNTLLKQYPDSIHSDKTHFNTPEAREILTKAVLKKVCPALGVDYDSLEMPDFSKEIDVDKEILS